MTTKEKAEKMTKKRKDERRRKEILLLIIPLMPLDGDLFDKLRRESSLILFNSIQSGE